mgnify:FL=1
MSIHRLVLTDGLNDIGTGLPNNFLFDCLYCAYPVATLTNQHNSALTLTNIVISTVGGQSVTAIQINGAPISYPYVIPVGGTIDIMFEICGLGTWDFNVVTAEHNNDASYTIPMTPIAGSALWDSTTIDFGSVSFGTTGSVVRTITNIACDTQYIEFTTGLCGSIALSAIPSGVIPVPPGATVSFTLEWTPSYIGQILSCTLYDSAAYCATFNAIGDCIETPPENHFSLVAGLDVAGNYNKLYCCWGCGINVSEFESNVGIPLDVTDLIIDTAGSGVTVNILTINGVAPSFPFIVPAYETFSVQFEICWDEVTSPLNPWTLTIETIQYGLDLAYEVLMICVTSSVYGIWSSKIGRAHV